MAQKHCNVKRPKQSHVPEAEGGLTMVEFGDLTDKLAGFKWEGPSSQVMVNCWKNLGETAA